MRPHAFGLQGISSKGRVRSTLVVAPLLSALASPIGCPACGRCSEACKALFPMLGIECEESLTHGIGAHWQWDLMKAKCDPDDQVRFTRATTTAGSPDPYLVASSGQLAADSSAVALLALASVAMAALRRARPQRGGVGGLGGLCPRQPAAALAAREASALASQLRRWQPARPACFPASPKGLRLRRACRKRA
ncbi:unnamed protein product [Prorocentrum cordatum]|uniref:4Fe-4S ferredoxin-type domain-containing protein n=1 Tax=Prorocentrum cordatum TaxID=2364126 RepID=A0ABN9W444_9DINO|nr:unnamed protein product [Polarella glacialis]